MTSNVIAATEQMDELKARKKELATMVQGFESKFDLIVPSHLNGSLFAALSMMSLRDPKVLEAALNNPQAFLSALVHSARLGHHPGTEAYYLVPFSPRRGEPRIIQGIEGYRGIVDRMYRAGYVTSVHAQVVRENDMFAWREGMLHPEWAMPKPFASEKDRGARVGVYCYVKLADPFRPEIERYSRPSLMNQEDVYRRRDVNAGSRSQFSPWNGPFEDSMWRKTVAREQEKWVPSSAEYRRHMDESAVRIEQIAQEEGLPAPAESMPMVDGEVVENDWPQVPPVPDAQ